MSGTTDRASGISPESPGPARKETRRRAAWTTLGLSLAGFAGLAAFAVLGPALSAADGPPAAPSRTSPPSSGAGDSAAATGPHSPGVPSGQAAPGRSDDETDGPDGARGNTARSGGASGPGGGARSALNFHYPSWDEISDFMTKNSPRKWEKFHAIPRGVRFRKDLQNQITSRYMMLTRLQRQAPDEYDLQVKRIRIEDDIFGAMLDYRAAADDKQREKTRQTMTEKVRELDDNLRQIDQLHLEKKQTRLANLKRQADNLKRQMDLVQGDINNLQGRLAQAESADHEASVQQRAEAYLKMQGFGSPRLPPRPRGPAGASGAAGATNQPNGGGPDANRRDATGQR